jgi:hypothetical protein
LERIARHAKGTSSASPVEAREERAVAANGWTLDELWRELAAWEEALHAEGYSQSTVWTYIRGSHSFLRWLGEQAGRADAAQQSPR